MFQWFLNWGLDVVCKKTDGSLPFTCTRAKHHWGPCIMKIKFNYPYIY